MHQVLEVAFAACVEVLQIVVENRRLCLKVIQCLKESCARRQESATKQKTRSRESAP